MTLPDVATLDTYGGPKKNYMPIVDPTVELDAEDHTRLASDVASLTRTAPRAARRFIAGAPPSEPLSGFVHEAMWGKALAYLPTVERLGTGHYRLTWPQEVDTELDEARLVNLRWATVHHESTTAALLANAVVVAPNQIEVYVRNTDGTLVDADGAPLVVTAY